LVCNASPNIDPVFVDDVVNDCPVNADSAVEASDVVGSEPLAGNALKLVPACPNPLATRLVVLPAMDANDDQLMPVW
jgi:hypothetical protein